MLQQNFFLLIIQINQITHYFLLAPLEPRAHWNHYWPRLLPYRVVSLTISVWCSLPIPTAPVCDSESAFFWQMCAFILDLQSL